VNYGHVVIGKNGEPILKTYVHKYGFVEMKQSITLSNISPTYFLEMMTTFPFFINPFLSVIVASETIPM